MDRRSLVILAACLLLMLMWPQLMRELYPPKPQPGGTNRLAGATNTLAGTNAVAPAPVPAANGGAGAAAGLALPNQPEQTLTLTNELAAYVFTSHGGGLKSVDLFKYPEEVGCGKKKPGAGANHFASLNPHAPLPVLALLGGEALQGDNVYQLSRLPGGVRAEKTLSNGLQVVKEFRLASNYLVSATVRLENRAASALALPAQQFAAGAATPAHVQDDGTFMGFFWHDGEKARENGEAHFANRTLGCIPGTPRTEFRSEGAHNVAWVAAHNQFFTLALMPKEKAAEMAATRFLMPRPSAGELAENPKALTNQFAFQLSVFYAATNLAPGLAAQRDFVLYAGPKEYRTIERVSADLKHNLDVVMGYGGFFGWFARGLLLSMNALNALGLPYWAAIVSITVIIKLLFWPLTQAATRSMKRMQALQPQMKALQEKHKDDPVKANKRVMELMREHKVSPIGGCLPTLLQIPVLIGFFQMVRSAIELRGARFLWACDLSKPDTVWVIPGLNFNVNPLPLLMGVTMIWQARVMPMSPGMDPMQQKIMKYFPLVFLVLLYDYSAGLTLYWTVQNLLTIAQMKLTKTKDEPAAAPAPARPAPPVKKKK
jgi:YidC/Oxa1 family membrane protein insertase